MRAVIGSLRTRRTREIFDWTMFAVLSAIICWTERTYSIWEIKLLQHRNSRFTVVFPPVSEDAGATFLVLCTGNLSAVPNTSQSSRITKSLPLKSQVNKWKVFVSRRLLLHPEAQSWTWKLCVVVYDSAASLWEGHHSARHVALKGGFHMVTL